MADVQYHGGDVRVMQKQKMVDDADYKATPVASGFTAINRLTGRPLTPQSLTTIPAQQNQVRRRRRTIAQYLGIEGPNESADLVGNALLPPIQLASLPKSLQRRQKGADKKTTGMYKRTSKQRHVSEEPHVRKTTIEPSALSPETSVVEASQSPSTCADASQSISTEDIRPDDVQDGQPHASHNLAVKRSLVNSDDSNEKNPPPSPAQLMPDVILSDRYTHQLDTDSPVQLYSHQFYFEWHDNSMNDDDFDDDIDDDDLMMLSSDILDSSSGAANLPNFAADTEQHHDYEQSSSGDTLVMLNERAGSPRRTKSKFILPVTPTTCLLAAKARKPIVRSPFPHAVRDRSPIVGLSSNMVLRTCLRIGEAINQSHQAIKGGKHVMLELYARVLRSQRDEIKQEFTLCDLFHAKPPYIKAVYDAAIWKPVQLFNYDSKRLLQEGKMCRCMGKMKRKGKEWIMTVLNIWEATWEDIEWVEGIVNS